MSKASQAKAPRHLGIILDGNRRWAREQGLPVIEGHRQGFRNVKTIARAALDEGVQYISAYAFSSENWKRNGDEVKQLMKLFLWILRHEVEQLNKEGIRLRVIGSRVRLGKALVKAIHQAEKETLHNTRGTLLLCLDYGGQQEIVEAVKKAVKEGYDPKEITPEIIAEHLYAPDIPPPDLIIRTSGEQRLSNFLLWQGAYSELMFTKTHWPAFSKDELHQMFEDYSHIKRRFGK